MARPSRIAQKTRREYERQQGIAPNNRETQDTRHLSKDSDTDKQLHLIRILGVIVIESRETALAIAAKEVGSYLNEDRLVLWDDVSGNEHSDCGIGIAYHTSNHVWNDLSRHIRGPIPRYLSRIYAIVRTLEIIWDICHNQGAERKPSKIVIYNDCASVLRKFVQFRKSLVRLKTLAYAEQLIVPGIIASEALSEIEVEVEVRYVPENSEVEGNAKADRAANIGRKHHIRKGKSTIARVVGA